LARGDGASCAYFNGHHRALVITPTWRDGAVQFKMLAGLGNTLAGLTRSGSAPDTLEGPWDQLSAGMDGNLYVLKGDKLLQVQYRSSPVPLAALIPLLRLAVSRM